MRLAKGRIPVQRLQGIITKIVKYAMKHFEILIGLFGMFLLWWTLWFQFEGLCKNIPFESNWRERQGVSVRNSVRRYSPSWRSSLERKPDLADQQLSNIWALSCRIHRDRGLKPGGGKLKFWRISISNVTYTKLGNRYNFVSVRSIELSDLSEVKRDSAAYVCHRTQIVAVVSPQFWNAIFKLQLIKLSLDFEMFEKHKRVLNV